MYCIVVCNQTALTKKKKKKKNWTKSEVNISSYLQAAHAGWIGISSVKDNNCLLQTIIFNALFQKHSFLIHFAFDHEVDHLSDGPDGGLSDVRIIYVEKNMKTFHFLMVGYETNVL